MGGPLLTLEKDLETFNIRQKLGIIQAELKAPKNKFNAFGKYKYRDLDGIYDSIKPLLAKYGCALLIDDKVSIIGETLFRISTATILCTESSEELTAEMYTQEITNGAGMSPAQMSGATASYSNKYVLNKLFCLDDSDSQDPDQANKGKGVTLLPDSDKPEDYRPKFGKHKGTPLKEVPREELISFCKWLGTQDSLGDMQKELITKARLFLTN
jgi:hypothetical protein